MNIRWRDLLRRWHPEGIPWPGSVLYNAISQTEIFNRHYALVAEHVGHYCRMGSILDIGTGPGWLLVALRRSLPELKLMGVDISPAMVATARENMKRAGYDAVIDLRVAAAQTLPYIVELPCIVGRVSYPTFQRRDMNPDLLCEITNGILAISVSLRQNQQSLPVDRKQLRPLKSTLGVKEGLMDQV